MSIHASVFVSLCWCIHVNIQTHCINSGPLGNLCQGGINSVRNSLG